MESLARWLWRAVFALVLAPASATAETVATYPTPAMMEDGCPASREGLWALDERVLRSDWAWLCRYRADNAAIDPAAPPRAVFIGDSITENWTTVDRNLFSGDVIGRGIAGQTSPQMLVRFWQDVIALRPRVVHIMAGTNDIAGNTGPTTPEAYQNAVRAMVTLAKANGIVVVIGSIPPSDRLGWNSAVKPAEWIARLNGWLKDYAQSEGAIFADYHAVLVGPNAGMREAYAPDGVHPNAAGYAAMRPVADRAIAAAELRAATR